MPFMFDVVMVTKSFGAHRSPPWIVAMTMEITRMCGIMYWQAKSFEMENSEIAGSKQRIKFSNSFTYKKYYPIRVWLWGDLFFLHSPPFLCNSSTFLCNSRAFKIAVNLFHLKSYSSRSKITQNTVLWTSNYLSLSQGFCLSWSHSVYL